MIYEIAGLKVKMEPRFGRLLRQSEDYQSSGEPTMVLPPLPADMFRLESQGFSPQDSEYIFFGAAFCRGILRQGRFFLHASAVVCEGRAYLFSAPSGTGKSTHTAQWLQRFPGCYILNDDKPVLYPKADGITVFGTPFSGKSALQVNRAVPLGGICFLKRGGENRIERLSEDRAIALLLNNTYRPKNGTEMHLLLDMLERTVAQADLFEMCCTDSPEAAEISYRRMKGM